MSASPQTLPPGWYPDGQGVLRWWDGRQWMQSVGTLDPYQAEMLLMTQAQTRSGRATGTLARIILWTLGILVALTVVIVLFTVIVAWAQNR